MATAFAGLEIRVPKSGEADVSPHPNWPLSLHAVIGYAPPYAVYSQADKDAGLSVPAGILDQWQILTRYGIPDRTFLFLNERDIVPGLSVGFGRHFGHRFRIQGSGAVLYDGKDTWGEPATLIDAHRSAGYCRDVRRALLQPDQTCGE
jgi:hypothetical protein